MLKIVSHPPETAEDFELSALAIEKIDGAGENAKRLHKVGRQIGGFLMENLDHDLGKTMDAALGLFVGYCEVGELDDMESTTIPFMSGILEAALDARDAVLAKRP